MKHRYLAFLASLLCINAHALPNQQLPPPSIRGFLGLTAGYDWATISESTDVLLLSEAPAPDTFTGSGDYSGKLLYGASLGLEFPIHTIGSRWQTSLAYYRAGDFAITGTKYMFGANDLGNIGYQYDVQNQRLMLENKLMFSLLERKLSSPGFFLYLMGGVGVSRNEASNYSAYSLEDTTISVGEFASNTANSFSYSAGFGIEAEFASFLRMGLGYRYADLGKVSLGTFDLGNTSEILTTTSMPTQEMVFQITIL
jgi:opacity protein-like surface antigen